MALIHYFTLPGSDNVVNNTLVVFINGIEQAAAEYTLAIDGGSFTLNTAPPVNSVVYCDYISDVRLVLPPIIVINSAPEVFN